MENSYEEAKKLLWKAFKEKLAREWDEKYYSYGTLSNIKFKTKLGKAIEYDFYTTLGIKKGKNNIERIPSSSRFDTYLELDRFPGNVQKWTLDSITKYTWFDEATKKPKFTLFEEFRIELASKFKNTTIAIPTTPLIIELNNTVDPIIDNTNITNKGIERENKQKKKIIPPFFIVIGSFLFFLFFFYQLNLFIINLPNYMKKEKEEILSTIKNANILEYKIYKSVPILSDTINLNKYYTSDGQARKNILEISTKAVTKERILDKKESLFKPSESPLRFKVLNPNYTVVETEEYWKVRWLHSTSGVEQHLYDELVDQIYRMEKGDSSWLIIDNIY